MAAAAGNAIKEGSKPARDRQKQVRILVAQEMDDLGARTAVYAVGIGFIQRYAHAGNCLYKQVRATAPRYNAGNRSVRGTRPFRVSPPGDCLMRTVDDTGGNRRQRLANTRPVHGMLQRQVARFQWRQRTTYSIQPKHDDESKMIQPS